MNLLFLTCPNKKEAKKISKALLESKLVSCIKMFNVSSSFLWKGKIDSAEEVLLIMDSKDSLFKKVETVVRNIHSYETFVLLSTPVNKASRGIKPWINKELVS